MIQFWLKLLRAHNKNRGYGLTLPFLVGALRIPIGSVVVDEKQNIDDVKNLLLSMRDNTPDTSYVSVTECDRLHQPVFAESSSYYTPPDVYTRIATLNSGKCFLYVAPNILPNEKQSVEELLDKLWKINGDSILRGTFSFSNGGFTKFSGKDYALIDSANLIGDDEEET
jgi:hypothetical protein